MLIDSFNRKLDYLRVSVTDRCNLRCVYCMPPEGVEWKPHGSMLTFEEILHLCRIMTNLGIKKIKVTGGEPLVRRGLASFVKNLKELPGIEKATLTTNGLLLGSYLDEAETLLPNSLPDGVNISLDALNADRYKRIARIPQTDDSDPEKMLPWIDRLIKKNIPVKLNCVPVRAFNDEEILPLAALAKDRNIAVRFIELMPMGSAAGLTPVTGNETAAILEKAYGALTPLSGVFGNGPAVYYSLPGFAGKIGFINPVSHGFCETCNRLRLSSDGFLKPCLSSEIALDLKTLLRNNASDTQLTDAIVDAAAKKPRFHTFSHVYGAAPAEHSGGMFGIGG